MARLDPDRIRAELWRPRADGSLPQIYAIVDGARAEQASAQAAEAETEYCCLYRGELDPELAKAAPYLVKLTPELPFTAWLLRGWGESWGIFVESAADLRILRRHFRTFLMVYDEDGKPLYFRYYDPRVLRAFLPTCNADDLKVLFGPVDDYLMESEDGAEVLRFAVADGNLIQSPEATSLASMNS